jgi:hypothetical protein
LEVMRTSNGMFYFYYYYLIIKFYHFFFCQQLCVAGALALCMEAIHPGIDNMRPTC